MKKTKLATLKIGGKTFILPAAFIEGFLAELKRQGVKK